MSDLHSPPDPLRVLLINPPRWNELIGKNPAIVEKHRGFNPPLGILQLAGYVEDHTHHRVEVLDTQPRGWDYAQLQRELLRREFDVVGITAMTFTLIDVILTCQAVRLVQLSDKLRIRHPPIVQSRSAAVNCALATGDAGSRGAAPLGVA